MSHPEATLISVYSKWYSVHISIMPTATKCRQLEPIIAVSRKKPPTAFPECRRRYDILLSVAPTHWYCGPHDSIPRANIIIIRVNNPSETRHLRRLFVLVNWESKICLGQSTSMSFLWSAWSSILKCEISTAEKRNASIRPYRTHDKDVAYCYRCLT